jgi:mannan endo-1,4-beta-mannosidase
MLWSTVAYPQPGLRVSGRHLLTPCGDTLVIRGVNKMTIWTDDLDVRKASYAEIKRTGANCVRIVWLAQPSPFEQDAGPDGLDRTIQDAIDAGLIPMVELHDATGDFSRLPIAVNYWTSPAVAAVVKKHERYLLVNIANEAGDETVTDQQFTSAYTQAVNALRSAGIRTPLVIDAADWGKNLEQLVRVGSPLQQSDPDHNLLFSVHMYWAVTDGADADFIRDQINAGVNAGLPFIVGEFTEWFNRDDQCTSQTDYRSIIQYCQQFGIGWLAWEWGPGNEYADPTCEIMNMTTNSTYATLRDTWARVVAEESTYSISNTSITHYYTSHHGTCDPTSVVDGGKGASVSLSVFPNPSVGHPTMRVSNIANDAIVHVRVFTMHGGLVFSTMHGKRHDDAFIVNLPITGSGVYVCVVSLNDHIVSSLFTVTGP